MLSINEDNTTKPIPLLQTRETKIKSERAFIISQFVEEINRERIGTKFKPATPRSVAIKLSLLKTNQELYAFLSECKDYKNRQGAFGKRFWGGCKIK